MKKVADFFGKLRRESSRAEKYKVEEFEYEKKEREEKEAAEKENLPTIYTFLGIDQVRSLELQTSTVASYVASLTLEKFETSDIVPLDTVLPKMPDSEKIYYSFALATECPPERKSSLDCLFQKTLATDYQPCDSDHWVMDSLPDAMLNRSTRRLCLDDVLRITVMQKWKTRMKEKYAGGETIEDVSNVEFKIWRGEDEEKELVKHCTFETFYVEDYESFSLVIKDLTNPDYSNLVAGFNNDLVAMVTKCQR